MPKAQAQHITIRGTDTILGIPAESMRGPGHYTIKNGHIIDFSPLAAVETEPDEEESVNVEDTPQVTEDLTRAPANNGG